MKPVYLSILQKETGTRIKTLLKEKGYTVKDIQEAMGFEYPQAIYKWLSGNSLPTLDNFVILSRVLNTRIEDILVIDEDIVFYLLQSRKSYPTSRLGVSAHFFCARTQKKKFHSSSEFDKISDGINQKGRAEKETDCYNEVKIRQIQSAYRQDKTLCRREEKTMKNRKAQFQKLGIAVFVIAVTGIATCAVQYNNHKQFDLTVGEHSIGKEEYLNCMKSVEYDTKMQIQQDYNAIYEEDFWEKEYDDKHGYEILAENTVEQLKYIHAVYDLAKECGDVSDSSYEALEQRWKDENAERSEKVAKGEVIYGLKEYTFQLYLDYEISTLKEQYCNDLTREGMELTEAEILECYESRDWIFGGSEENADLETARIAVEREVREQKYDEKIAQLENDSQVNGDMEQVSRFTLKNIE